MSVYRRGNSKVWSYKFKFNGQLIKKSTGSTNVNIARDIERERRQQLERAAAGVPLPAAPKLFRKAAEEWLDMKAGGDLKDKTVNGYRSCIPPLVKAFGNRLVIDITCQDVLAYRAQRLKDSPDDKPRKENRVGRRPDDQAGTKKKTYSHRTVNYELLCLRGIIGKVRWAAFEDELAKSGLKNFHLKERKDAGKAISYQDEFPLLAACLNSQSPALHPMFVVTIDTGLRSSELKALRHRDLILEKKRDVITSGELIVPKSKTKKGEKRVVGLTPRVCAVLTHWLRRFPNAGMDSYVFPRHDVRQVKGNRKMVEMSNVDLNAPVKSWKRAWNTAKKSAKLNYRWHDLRHTFITRLAGNPAVSEQTVRDLAGHVSEEMMDLYSHIRRETKRSAISALAATVEAEHARVLAGANVEPEQSSSNESFR